MSTQVNAPSAHRGRLPLILVFAIFLVPAVAAWVLYAFFPDAARSLGTTNYGNFVHPSRFLERPVLPTPGGESLSKDFLTGKWTYVYIDSAQCGDTCRKNIYKMRQVRLAQGEEMFRVQRLFVLTGTQGLDQLREFLDAYSGMAMADAQDARYESFIQQFSVGEGHDAAVDQRVYIVDPAGRLMMYYDADADPKGMMQDMEKLLHDSQIG